MLRLTTSWMSGFSVQIVLTPATTRSVNQPLVGMLTTAGWQWRTAEPMILGRSLRRKGSPPLKVIHAGALPIDLKTSSHSSAFSSTTLRS